jgi:sec-independent protein translocase protein TatC
MAEKDKELTFWDHLDALRGVLFRIAAVVIILGIAAFCVMPWLFDNVIMAPCRPDFPLYRMIDYLSALSGVDIVPHTDAPFSVNIMSLELTSQFLIHMSASCWLACIVGFPIIIYLIWTFVEPALYEHEKHGARRAFIFGNIMFFLGVFVGYILVFPLAVRFLASYKLSDAISCVVSLDSYMDNFFTICLMMGIVFELPLLAWLLGKIGLLDRSFFSHYRRHAIVALLILAAFITPTGDPFTLFAVFFPIYALWEFSSRLVPPQISEDK